MTELQRRLLDLMVETDEICRKHDIKYMLFAGTALGAERHGGFIPWDDDADIIMTLPDYEKYLEVMKEEIGLHPDRAFDALEWDTDYILTYARYVDTSSTAIQRHTLFGGATPGVKLDVFCVVPTYDDEDLIAKHREDILAFSEVVCDTGRMITYRPAGFYKRYREEVRKMEAVGREQYIRDNLRPLMHRVEGRSDKCILFSGMASNTKLYDSKIFDEVKYVPFEDTELPISTENILFSEQHLGRDWMALPPDITQPKHLFLLDVDRPYADYVELAKKTMDLEKCRKAAVLKKENNLIEKDEYRDILKNNQVIRNLASAINTENAVARVGVKDGEKDPAGVFEAIRPYVTSQLSRSSRTHGLTVPLSRDTFLLALRTLLAMGRYYDADNIIRAVSGDSLVTDNREIIDAITADAEVMRELEALVYVRNDFDAARALIAEHPQLAGTVTAAAADAYMRLRTADSEEAAKIYEDLDAAVSEYGKVGELRCLQGICLEKQGKDGEAKTAFEEAMKTIRNGFLYQQMVNRGIPTTILFEETERIDAARPKVRTRDIIKGKPSGPEGLVRAAKKAGCTSLGMRLRYLKYDRWNKKEKSPADKSFKEYEKQLFGLKLED